MARRAESQKKKYFRKCKYEMKNGFKIFETLLFFFYLKADI